MHEIDVVVSDLLLGSLALWLGLRVRDRSEVQSGVRLIFLSVAAGALLGAIWHGFYSDAFGIVSIIIWRLTMLSVGITAYGFALLGIGLLNLPPQRWMVMFRVVLLIYLLAILFSGDFLLAILVYLPAALLALAGYVRRSDLPGIASLVLILLASVYQQWGPDLEVWLTHNTVYHLLLIAALILLRKVIGSSPPVRT